MEFKKKTIIGEDNNEPPKDYIGAKKDGKFYEYSYTTRSGVESKTVSGGNSGESGGSGGGGGDDEPTPTPSGIIGFPYQPATLVGWVDNTNWEGYSFDWQNKVVNILKEPILPQNLEEYFNNLISQLEEDSCDFMFLPLFEYDINMDIAGRDNPQDWYDNPPEAYGGNLITISYNKTKNSKYFWQNNSSLDNRKAVYNGEEYLIAVPQGD